VTEHGSFPPAVPGRALPVGMAIGNVLGLLEILYIRYELRMLHAESLSRFLQYLAGGAVVYGALFGLLVGGGLFLLGIGAWPELRGEPGVRHPALMLAVLAAGAGFLVAVKTIHRDVPGFFELDRHLLLLLGSAAAGLVLYGLLRTIPALHPPLRRIGGAISRPGTWRGLFGLNLIGLLVAIPVFRPPLPPLGVGAEAAGPPVVLIGVDTLRADHLEPWGSGPKLRTPAARRLARDGVTYLQHTAQWPRTTPSFASMFTSLYPAEIPLYGNAEPLPPGRVTLAERLAEAGYSTTGIVSSYAVHGRFLGRGFDHYVNREDRGMANLKLLRYLLHLSGGGLPTQAAVDAVRAAESRSFFLFVHYILPHAPYHPPYPYSRRYDPGYRGRASGSQGALAAMRSGRAFTASADRAHVRALYDGEVAFTDRRILRLLRALERANLYRPALILYVSDHGENMDQHGRRSWFKHRTLYQSDLHVPMIVKYPGNRRSGTRVTQLTTNLDVVPTVLDALGMEVPEGLRGRSLAAEAPPRRPRIFAQKKRAAALRTPRWKYVHRFDTGTDELYDLRRDPRETLNRIEQHPGRARRFRRRLERFRSRRYRTPGTYEHGEKDRTRLRGLGYF